jgi:two-component system phosphate regulon sensor histidine kinase PhoR
VSHELKTPLALVRMYGETLSLGRARDEAQAAEFGGIIARESERLSALIQRILDFSRQQAGTLTYAATTFDLGQRLRRVVEDYSPHLASRGVFVVDDLPSDIRVHCDQNALESAIVNLLENAAKYGRDGETEHEIELALTTADGAAVVEVRDHGRGIPPEERERIFDGFYRATNAGEARGAGLGLNLVRHFARAHGGDITARPRDGGGTVMRLTLPLATSAATMAVANAPHDS